MVGSANLNIMIKAARKAGRSLVKDFREVENLQVSVKGAGDFVSRANDREPQEKLLWGHGVLCAREVASPVHERGALENLEGAAGFGCHV